MKRGRPAIPAKEKILKNIRLNENGCWLWVGKLNKNGYSTLSHMDQTVSGHRLSFETFRYKIPKNKVIDHICRVTACVNPEHLDAVSIKDNNRRAKNLNREKTHCKRGHEYTNENTYVEHNNKGHTSRQCRKCNALNARRRREVERSL